MQSATIFINGLSTQAVRIPKEFRLKTREVWIEKVGDCLILTPKPQSWDDFFASDLEPTHDFDMTRDMSAPQNRGEVLS